MLKSPQHLLVFRFSALGDVAMTVPVVKSLLQQHPDLRIIYVSNAFVAPLFSGIERLQFHAADIKGRHKGVKGLYTLYRELSRAYDFDAIADLHNVLRTKILRFFFAATFKPIAVIDKGRKEKKELTRKENKILRPLKSTIQRYADVFAALGLPVQLNQDPSKSQKKVDPKDQANSGNLLPLQNHTNSKAPANPEQQSQLFPNDATSRGWDSQESWSADQDNHPIFQENQASFQENHASLAIRRNRSLLVGVAPFAQHPEKMYPNEKMKEVLRLLLQHQNVKVLLFGGGKSEITHLQEWEKELPGLESVAGKMSFQDELKLISQLDVMVSMDSANMHLASLNGVPVISIWGATHPFAGFYGWGQSPEDAIQVDLYCRPCSVFGNKPCFRGDLACMHSIAPVTVVNKIMEKLNNLEKSIR